jgi:hypothetical protein
MRLDQGPSVAAAAARQTRQRAFRVVDRDARAALVDRDLALRQGQMPAAKFVDRGLRRFRNGRFSLCPDKKN